MKNLSKKTKWLLSLFSILSFFILFVQLTVAQAVPGRRLDDIVIEVVKKEEPPDDGYWKWLPGHIIGLESFSRHINELKIKLPQLAAQIRMERARQFTLLRIYLNWLNALEDATTAPSPKVMSSNRSQRAEMRQNIVHWKDMQNKLIEEAVNELSGILKKAEAQLKRSGKRRPGLDKEIQRLKDEYLLLKLYLYDYAELYGPDELQSIIRKLKERSWLVPSLALLLEAKARLADAKNLERRAYLESLKPGNTNLTTGLAHPMQMASQTQRLEAIIALRRLLNREPKHMQARSMLREVELYWLKRIAIKLDRERKVSMDAFARYLTNRGFDAQVRSGWLQFMKDYAYGIWGLGPISAFAGIPGIDVPGAMADVVGIQQLEAATYQVSLMAIIRLVKKGLTLKEVRYISTEELSKYMTMEPKSSNQSVSPKIMQLAKDIQQTFNELDDLRVLASDDDPIYFVVDVNTLFTKNYFVPVDAEYHWYEWFGDIINIHNLITLWGPGAVARVGGKLQGVSYMTYSEIGALREAGKLTTVADELFLAMRAASSQVAVGGYNLDTIGAQFKKTGLARWLRYHHLKDIRAVRSRTTLQRAATSLSRLGATLILFGGAFHLANSTGIPGAALMVELLASFEVHDRIFNFMAKSGVPVNKFVNRVDDFTNYLESRQKHLSKAKTQSEELSLIASKSRSSGRVVEPSLKDKLGDLEDAMDLEVLGRPPQGVDEAIDHAAAASARELKKGHIDEAQRSLDAMDNLTAHSEQTLSEASEKAARAEALLAANVDSATGSQLADDIVDEASEIAEELGQSLEQRSNKVPKDFYDPSRHGETTYGQLMKDGDEAYRHGRLDDALEHFREARRIEKGRNPPRLSRIETIEREIYKLERAIPGKKVIGAAQKAVPPAPITMPIGVDESEKVLEQISKGEYKQLGGGANPLFEIIVKDEVTGAETRYLVKKLDSAERLEADVAGTAIANAVGIDAPATRKLSSAEITDISVTFTKDGKTKTENLGFATVMRPIDEFAELYELPEHVFLTVREEYAKHRALRAFLGDTDGHVRNVLMGPNGRLIYIDSDLANLSGLTVRHIGNAKLGSHEEVIKAAIGFSHGNIPLENMSGQDRVMVEAFVHRMKTHPLYGWNRRFDQMIRYDDMVTQVKEIEKFMADKEAFIEALRNAGISGGRADEIYKNLKPRADVSGGTSVLEKVLSSDEMFGGAPIRFSFLLYRNALYAFAHSSLHPRSVNRYYSLREAA